MTTTQAELLPDAQPGIWDEADVPWPVRQLVLARDNWACLCCDKSILGRPHAIQLRKPRQVGGNTSAENLITVLAECGRRIRFALAPADAAAGLRLGPREEPALVPVTYPTPAGQAKAWLLPDGTRSFSARELPKLTGIGDPRG